MNRRPGAPGAPQILLTVSHGDWGKAATLGAIAKRAIGAAMRAAAMRLAPASEVSILLADDATMRGLNRRWRGINKPTNVLSFPGRDLRPGEIAGPALGDIALARETLVREALEQGKAFADHFAHLIAHGFLHLGGYDHLNEADARVMETIEREALAAIGIADPYREQPGRATIPRRRKPRS